MQNGPPRRAVPFPDAGRRPPGAAQAFAFLRLDLRGTAFAAVALAASGAGAAGCFAARLRAALGFAALRGTADLRAAPPAAAGRFDQRVHGRGQRIDPLGQPGHVVLGVDAQLRQRFRDAILEHLLELVPRSAGHRLHLLRLLRRSARRRGRGLRGGAAGARLQALALLDQRLEHLHAFRLRPRERAQPREPDLPRRLLEVARHLVVPVGGFRLRPGLLEHLASCKWSPHHRGARLEAPT